MNQQAPPFFVTAIIVAGGNSRRMGGENKILTPIGGIPAIGHTLLAFDGCIDISQIIVVCRSQDEEAIREIAQNHLTRLSPDFAPNGLTRQESVFSGVAHCSPQAEYLAIHDGARPFVTPDQISSCIVQAISSGAATLAVPVTDTIKMVENGQIIETLNRSALVAVQTPQIFALPLYLQSMKAALNSSINYTDDNQLLEASGVSVSISEGSSENIKLTTPFDFRIGEEIIRHRKEINR